MSKWILSAFVVAIFTLTEGHTQTIEALRNRLGEEIVSEQAPDGARVRVIEHEEAAGIVAASDRKAAPARLNGYRVCIFFDNGQDARAGAMEAKKTFEEQFPDIKLYMVYENPYFRVTVGNCLTIEEAVILKGRVATAFPKAFPKAEELQLSDLLE